MEYDLGLDDADDSGSWNDSVVELDSGIENDSAKIIDFSKMPQTLGDKVLSENDAFKNKNIGDSESGSATYSEISADRLTEELTGILSFS